MIYNMIFLRNTEYFDEHIQVDILWKQFITSKHAMLPNDEQ